MRPSRPGAAVGRVPAAPDRLADLQGLGLHGLAQLVARAAADTPGDRAGGALDDGRIGSSGLRVDPAHDAPGRPMLVHGLDADGGAGPVRRTLERAGRREVLLALTRDRAAVAVVGGRRASLAGAMAGWTLELAGRGPTVVLDAASPQLGGRARLGRGAHCLLQCAGDDADVAAAGPAVVLVLDPDPAVAPRPLVEAIPPGGCLIGPEGPGALEAPPPAGVGRETIATHRGATWWGADLREDRGRFRFRAFRLGRFVLEAKLQVPGESAVLGALGAIAACARLELPAAAIKEGLEEFAGLTRGFEVRGSYRGATLVDDDARGPAEVAAGLGLARGVYGRRRLWAVAGSEALGADSGDLAGRLALAQADRVVVLCRSPGDDGPADALATALRADGRPTWRVASPSEAAATLDRLLEPGDVVLTLGADDVGTLADALTGRLPRDRQAV